MEKAGRERWALPFLGVACAVGVASIYLNQPLLPVMGQTLRASPAAMSSVAVATQIGYAVGILFFVPLGDVAERRALMMRLFAGASVALLFAAVSPNYGCLLAASIFVGLLASVTHVVLPIAPGLVSEEQRGHAVGTVMTGLLLGILLARSVAGWVSGLAGWRSVFLLAAVLNLLFVPILWRAMPVMRPPQELRYREAMRSLWTLFRREPLLREAATMGALCFATFSCFWTTLAFLLQAHYGLGPSVAGTFGVAGAVGALAAPFAGGLADRRGTRFAAGTAGSLLTASAVWLWGTERIPVSFAWHMVGLVLGVLLLDVGTQMMQVANQTRIFGLGAEVRSRLNTLYMTAYFVGGAAGSALAGVAWSRWGWDGVCGLQVCLMALAGFRHLTGYSRRLAATPVPAAA